MIPRTYHSISVLNNTHDDHVYAPNDDHEHVYPSSQDDANVISSRVAETYDPKDFENATHAPAIDIDVPIAVIPSSTPGHFHLYIDKRMTWPLYKGMLQALADAGVVEQGYVDASVQGRST